jgi:hypothetical protein
MILICTQLFNHMYSTTKIEMSPNLQFAVYSFVETIDGLMS